MTRRIAFLNEKGGTGKSTSALNVAAILASRFQQRVLLVDADHQANVTRSFVRDATDLPNLAHVLVEDTPAVDVIRPTGYERLHLLPADPRLAEVNIAMADPTSPLGIGRELRLRRALLPVEDRYDVVVVDTGPQRSLLNINVLNFVEEILVPIDPGYWSVLGVQHLEELVSLVRQHMGHESLRIAGVLLTKMQRTNVAKEVEDQVREHFGPLVFRATIPLNVKVEEAHSRGQSVVDYAPGSPGADAYLAVTHEILGEQAKENRAGVVPVSGTAENAPAAAA